MGLCLLKYAPSTEKSSRVSLKVLQNPLQHKQYSLDRAFVLRYLKSKENKDCFFNFPSPVSLSQTQLRNHIAAGLRDRKNIKQTRDQWREGMKCCLTDHWKPSVPVGGNGLSVVYSHDFKDRSSPKLFPELEKNVSNFKCEILYEDTLLKIILWSWL